MFLLSFQNDGKYIYLVNQFAGNNQLITTIDVYILTGTPVKRVRLDKHIDNILIDPQTKKLYAHAQLENEDRIYVYDFSFLEE